jgi:hypothetical protein
MSMRSSSAFEKFRLSASLPLRQLGASRSGCTQARHSPASSRRTIVACGAGEPENAGTLCEFARRRAGGFAPASPRGTRKPAPSVDRDTQSATRRGAGPPAAAPGCPKRLSERREARFIASSHALPRAPRVRRLADAKRRHRDSGGIRAMPCMRSCVHACSRARRACCAYRTLLRISATWISTLTPP